MRTAVLVHGAWHGAWCWEAVTPALDRAGVPHHEVELPFTGHADDVAATIAALDSVGGPKLLVGHSYGGLVISGAAEGRTDVEHLVYVCAFLAAGGKTVFDGLAGSPVPKIFHAVRDGDDGTSTIDPALAPEVFFAECTAEVAAAATARLRPIAHGSTSAVCLGEPWRTVPSTYVLCERDEAIPIEAQRRMSTRASDSVWLDTDHSPFYSRTDELAELLIVCADG